MGFTIALAVFIFFGILWGLIRGLKRTTGRLLFLLITSVILLFITVPLTKLLLNIPINTTITYNGEEIVHGSVKISDIIVAYIKAFLGEEFITKNPQFVSVLTSIPLILVNAFVYLLLFWLFKYLLLPIDHLLYKAIFDRKRKKKEAMGFSAWDFGDDDNTKPLQSNPSQTTSAESSPTPPTPTPQPETQQPAPETPATPPAEDPVKLTPSVSEMATTSAEPAKAEPTSDVGMFIKKEEDIATANAHGASNMPTFEEAHNDTNNAKGKAKKEKPQKVKEPRHRGQDSDEKYVKPKKHRLLGALVGSVVGLVITINTMMPLYGLLNILESNKDTEIKNVTETTYSLDSASGGLATQILKGYETSLMHTLGNSIGLEQLYLVGFDQLTSTTINGKKIVLRDDIQNLVGTIVQADKTFGLYKKVNEHGIANMTQAELNEIITAVEDLLAQSKKVQFLNCLADYLLPAATNYVANNEIRLAADEKINDLLLDTIEELTTVANVNLFEEAEGMIDIVKYINSQNLLLPVITNKLDDPVTIIHNVDDDFSNQLVERILSLKLVNTTIANVFNIGLTALDNSIHFGYVKNDIEKDDFIDRFTEIINEAFDTAKTISNDSPIYLTQESLVPLGQLLNTIKDGGIINTETYNNVISYTTRKLKQLTPNAIPKVFKDYVNNSLLENIGDVTDWAVEMGKIDTALNILRDKDNGILGKVQEGYNKRVGYSIEFSMSETIINNFGAFLDALETSQLFGGNTNIYDSTETIYASTSVTKLLTTILNYAHEQISEKADSGLRDMLSIIKDMQDNIIRCGHSTTDEDFWTDEISKVSPLISNVYNMLQDSSNNGQFELSNSLGSDLDRAKKSNLLGGDTTLKIVNIAMDKVKEMVLGANYEDSGTDTLNDKINALFTDIKDTLEDANTTTIMQDDNDFWTKEISCFKSLQKLSEDSGNISNISACLAIAEDIDKAYTSRLIPATSLDGIIATVIRQIKTNDTTGINGKINTLIENIATDIEDPTFFATETNPDGHSRVNFWATELNHINRLKSLDLDNSTSSNLADNIRFIGVEIDKVVDGYTDGEDIIRGSYLITEPRVRDLLATAIEEMSGDIVDSFDATMSTIIGTAVTSIKNNIANTSIEISSFAYELGNIATLTTLDISKDIFNIPTGTDIGSTIDSIAFNTIETSDHLYMQYSDNNSKIVTRTILNTLIKDTFGLAKNNSTTNTYETVFNDLIDNIQDSINTIAITQNKVFSWEKELAFVTKLTSMNKDQEYSLDNASTTIATNIDAIAFNTFDQNNTPLRYNDLIYSSTNLEGGYSAYEVDNNRVNSLFITRTILKDAVASLVEDFKVSGAAAGSKDEITNDLIDNISTTINTGAYNTAGNYKTYVELFTELNTVKDDMESLSNSITTSSDIISDAKATELDVYLDTTQAKLICGVVTTRKVAKMILSEVRDNVVDAIHTAHPELTDTQINNSQTMQYIDALESHYTNKANSTTPENYNVTTPDTYDNPFRSILAKYNAEFNSTP